MKKIIALIAMLVLLTATVSALKTYEVRRTGSATFEYRLNLLPVAPAKGAGFAIIRSVQNQGASMSTVVVRVTNLREAQPNQVYELWVGDEESGYTLSLGQFITGRTGYATFATTYRGYFHEFDHVYVSVEPFPDTNPAQNKVVLAGDIIGGTSLVRTRASVHGRTLGAVSERGYVGYQSQVAPQLPYRRSPSLVTY